MQTPETTLDTAWLLGFSTANGREHFGGTLVAGRFVERHSRKLIWGSDCDCRNGKVGGIKSGRCLAEQSLAALRKLVLRRILYENELDCCA